MSGDVAMWVYSASEANVLCVFSGCSLSILCVFSACSFWVFSGCSLCVFSVFSLRVLFECALGDLSVSVISGWSLCDLWVISESSLDGLWTISLGALRISSSIVRFRDIAILVFVTETSAREEELCIIIVGLEFYLSTTLWHHNAHFSLCHQDFSHCNSASAQ